MPSFFSCEEKYGEKKKTCRSRFSDSASANSPSSSWILSSASASWATSNSERE